MDLSIIVLSYNTKNTTLRCLQELDDVCTNSPSLRIELLVVDNASTDGSADALANLHFRNLQYVFIKNTKNVGFSKGNNVAIKKAQGAYILFLNSDVMVGVDLKTRIVFKQLISYLDSHSEVGALTVRLERSDGTIDPASHRGFPTPWRSFTYFSKLEYITSHLSSPRLSFVKRLFGGYHLLHEDFYTTHTIEAGTAAFLLCRGSLIRDLHGFDEQFFMYGEDLDLCYRIWLKGYTTVWYPKFSAVHLKYQSGIHARALRVQNQIRWHFYDEMERFYRKHYQKNTPTIIHLGIIALIRLKKMLTGGSFKNPNIISIRKVGIDARLMYQTGVGVYIRNLLLNLATLDTENIEFYIYARNVDIARFRLQETKLYKAKKFIFRPTSIAWHGFAEQLFFWIVLRKDKLDLMHFTYVSWPVLYSKPFIATLHDTILLTHPTGKATTKYMWWYWIKHLVFRFVLAQQVGRAKKIIVPSQAVAQELARVFPNISNKVVALYEGVDQSFIHAKSDEVKTLIDTPFFLTVGNAYPHKRIELVIEAFEKLQKQFPHAMLCIVGPDNYFSHMLGTMVEHKNIRNHVLFLHNVSVGKLKWLYEHAVTLVFPSLAEGFGLPVVEALYCKCPLILSDIPVFREIAESNATYVAGENAQAYTDAMLQALSKKKEISSHFLDRFSFRQMTEQILVFYKGLA